MRNYAPPSREQQLWVCSVCSRIRQWGFGTPPREDEGLPRFLFCNRCNCHTRHDYHAD